MFIEFNSCHIPMPIFAILQCLILKKVCSIDGYKGATTLIITTLSMITLSIETLSISALCIRQ